MSAHYLFRPYVSLPNYYGDAYVPPTYAAWQNYTVPFATPPGWYYSPHYYAPRNEATELTNVVCQPTIDHRYCPQITKNVSNFPFPSTCELGTRKFTSTQTLAECEYPGSWPAEIVQYQ